MPAPAMSVHGPLGATHTGAVQIRARARRAYDAPALRDRAGLFGIAGLLVTTLLVALAAAHTDALLPESVRPVPQWLAGPFGSAGLDIGSGGLIAVANRDVRLIRGRRPGGRSTIGADGADGDRRDARARAARPAAAVD